VPSIEGVAHASGFVLPSSRVAPGFGVWGNILGTEVLMSLIGIPVHDLTSKAGDSLDLQEGGPVRGRSHPYCLSGGTLSNSLQLRSSIQD
jgi:hypothetical protein